MYAICMSPTVYQFDGIKIKIHANDHNPPHVHVEGKGCEARFDLRTLELISNDGFSSADIDLIKKEIQARAIKLMEIWNAYQD
jgi:hypothetical protein